MTTARRRSYIPSQATWEAFLCAWWESYGEELAGLSMAPEGMQAALGQEGSTRSAIRLGLLVRRHLLDKTMAGLRMSRAVGVRTGNYASLYVVRQVVPEESARVHEDGSQ